MAKRLNQAIIYNLYPKVVQNNVKNFMSSNIPVYVNKILFVDKNGIEYLGEYLSSDSNQTVFTVGTQQPFMVKEVQQHGDVITPVYDFTGTTERTLRQEFLRPVTGETYATALQHSVSLMCTAKQCQDFDDTDIDKILGWADRMDRWLIDKQASRIIGD